MRRGELRWLRSRLTTVRLRGVVDTVRNPPTARGVREVEMAWILEDNAGMRNIIEAIRGRDCKRYRVHEKQLP